MNSTARAALSIPVSY